MNQEKTLEEKIDFIYTVLLKEEKKRKRAIILKWTKRVIIVSIVLFMYYFGIRMMINHISDNIKKTLHVDYIKEKKNDVIKFGKDIYNKLKKTKENY